MTVASGRKPFPLLRLLAKRDLAICAKKLLGSEILHCLVGVRFKLTAFASDPWSLQTGQADKLRCSCSSDDRACNKQRGSWTRGLSFLAIMVIHIFVCVVIGKKF